MIYHCGPVVQKRNDKWVFTAAGPTTSIREEPYQADVIGHFGMRAVIGKGGMGARTLEGCRKYGAVYLHAIGGAATLIGQSVNTSSESVADFGVARGVLGDRSTWLPGRSRDWRGRAPGRPARAGQAHFTAALDRLLAS